MKKISTPSEVRSWLITFALVLSYVCFTMFGLILAKYRPAILLYLDYAFIPIGLASIFFIYLFAMTHEERKKTQIPKDVKEVAELYGKGLSFSKIAETLDHVRTVSDVKRKMEKYCSYEGVKND